MSNMKNLYLDMDGTMNNFFETEAANDFEKTKFPGFYLNLKPYKNIIEALRLIHFNFSNLVNLSILSHTNNTEICKDEKKIWSKKEVDFIKPENIFLGSFEIKKTDLIPNGNNLTENDFLLDDFTKMLNDWEDAGGKSIKAINSINKNSSWNKDFIDINEETEIIYFKLLKVMNIA